MIRVALLGSTGSIGENTLRVIRRFPEHFKVVALGTNSNVEVLSGQVKEFKPAYVAVRDPQAGKRFKKICGLRCQFLCGEEGFIELAAKSDIDRLVLAVSGSGALAPLLKAVESSKTIALANKEALVMAGPIINAKVNKHNAKIIPVDSEQSAIWQCLDGQDRLKLRNIYLTASGGPLRSLKKREFSRVSVNRVLRHPRWKMGKKISVDSATLMNKGLELLEAMFLFGVGAENIKIVVHPEAIIHSMVEFIDGVVLAQLSVTDMRIPIQYALSYPERLDNPCVCGWLDFCKLGALHFERPDLSKFPCLGLAMRAAKQLGTMPAVLNAANEVAVDEFLRGRIKFVDIPLVIERVMDRHKSIRNPNLGDVLCADIWARKESAFFIARLN